jgi:phosphotriesterase-related protein
MHAITVQGEVDAAKLGVIAPHEHLLLDLSNQFREPAEVSRKAVSHQKVGITNLGLLRRNPLALRDNLIINDVACAEAEAMQFKRAGGDTMADLTNIGLGRDVRALLGISRATGLNIIAGSGYYYHDTHPSDMGKRSVSKLAEEMARDITEGVDNTGIRAGVIGEIGISPAMHPHEKKVLQAAAKAQKQTGAGISVHIFPWAGPGRLPQTLCVCRRSNS